MRSLLAPLALIVLTGAAAPAGCTLNMGKSPDTSDPAEIGTLGRACEPEVWTTIDLPDEVAYILEVEGAVVGDGEDILTPIDWSATADTLSVFCPAETYSFIASYATTETL